jgi:hypothetical protein
MNFFLDKLFFRISASKKVEKANRRMGFNDYPIPKWLTEPLLFYLVHIRPTLEHLSQKQEELLLHSRNGNPITHSQMMKSVKYIFESIGIPSSVNVCGDNINFISIYYIFFIVYKNDKVFIFIY